MDLKHKIESILFVSNKPLSVKTLAKFLEMPEGDIVDAARELAADRNNSGVVVLEASNTFQMATHSENSEIVKGFLNSDLREKLTEATVEVLSIIAYRQPISKAELEAIRGVNSQYSIRALLMRGLVEKVPNPNDARGHLYQVTTEFLQHLGITKIEDLPDFDTITSQIKLPETPQAKEAEAVEQDTLSNNDDVPDMSVDEQDIDELETSTPSEPTAIAYTETIVVPVHSLSANSNIEPDDELDDDEGDEDSDDDDDDEDEDDKD